jgi:ABC-type ATPase involved in cell division
MDALLKFVDVRCTGSDLAHTFTLHAGEMRLWQLASGAEKNAMIDSVIGVTLCAEGDIETVQGERRHKKIAVNATLGERRQNNGPLPVIWQPVHASRNVAWVAADGGLISNLRIWENVTLPLWYHDRREVMETEQSVRHSLGVLGLGQDEFGEFMVAQPDSIESWQRKLAGLLRGLLQKSPVIVVDATLFDDVNARLADYWISALESCAAQGRAVLVMSDRATALPWEKIE